MPKIYSESERATIISNLRYHTSQCLSVYGIKKTTVDEIVRRAKIPKGTFYLFYQSKEILIFEVIMQWHDSLQNELTTNISKKSHPITVDILVNAIFGLYKKVEANGFLAILSNGEIETLIRKLPQELVAEHLIHDDNMIENLIKNIPAAKGKDIKIFSAAFRGIFFMLLFRSEIGENFDKALKISIRGLVIQLLEVKNND